MPTNTCASILKRVIETGDPTLTPEAARSLLRMTFCQADRDRANNLLERNQEGLLSPEERTELEEYVRANDLVSLLKSKARLTLKRAGLTP